MKQNLLLLILFFTVCSAFSQTVYITKTGEKYHTENCVHLKKSSIMIQLADAVELGYQACKVCKPNNEAKLKPAVNSTKIKQEVAPQKESASVQCLGKTKKGVQKNDNKFQWKMLSTLNIK